MTDVAFRLFESIEYMQGIHWIRILLQLPWHSMDVLSEAFMSAFPSVEFAVIRRGGEWQVLRNGSDAGHYDFSVDAVEAAMIKAGKLIEKGEAATVLIQDQNGQLRPVDQLDG